MCYRQRTQFKKSLYFVFMNRFFLVIFLICFSTLGQATPKTRAVSDSTLEREVNIGRKAHEELAKTTHFYQDEKLNTYVNDIGQKLASVSDWPEVEYHFFIVDSPNINAFALPGGYIYINRGLLSYLTSEA